MSPAIMSIFSRNYLLLDSDNSAKSNLLKRFGRLAQKMKIIRGVQNLRNIPANNLQELKRTLKLGKDKRPVQLKAFK